MAQSLIDKVREAFVEAGGEGAQLELEVDDLGKVGGMVLSDAFAMLSPTERQDHLWASLEQRLSPLERARVTFIVADTFAEYEALKRAAG